MVLDGVAALVRRKSSQNASTFAFLLRVMLLLFRWDDSPLLLLFRVRLRLVVRRNALRPCTVHIGVRFCCNCTGEVTDPKVPASFSCLACPEGADWYVPVCLLAP